jgi:uncharacterized coiled-coil protein SlyX
MNQAIDVKSTMLSVRNLIRPATTRCGFVLVVFAVASFALSPTPKVFGVTPAPDGGYSNNNTAEGTQALFHNTANGTDNTAIGFQALFKNTDGIENTAVGSGALFSNTSFASSNTAIGFQALFSNTGDFNTAAGSSALFSNTTGNYNTAAGNSALFYNTTGSFNTANGDSALFSNTTGDGNTATGDGALINNTTGNLNTATGSNALSTSIGNNNTATGYAALCGGCVSEFIPTGSNNTATGAFALISNNADNNTATGFNALYNNATGTNNTAEGFQALVNNTTGSNNIALGANAGINLTTGKNNIIIGASGTAGESNTIRIGKDGVHKAAYMGGIRGATVASGVTVIVGASGHLGTIVSSQRFKDEIKPMDKASEAILALKPVTFRYKKELDPENIPQFGLVAEDVAKVNPDLVARDEEGQVYTVRYEAVNAMLLNEFLKEHWTVQGLKETVANQELTIAQQQQQIKALTASLKEQATQIQKVSAWLELAKPAPQIIANSH